MSDESPVTEPSPAEDPTPTTEPSGRGRRVALVGGAAAAVLVVGGGVFAWSQLSGGGTQPHDVLPADSIAYLRLDLDPDAGQKVDLFRLTQRVPDLAQELGIEDEDDDVRRLVLEQALGGCDDVDYASDVEPWLGERIGIAVGPEALLDEEVPDLRIAIQVDDEDAARDGVAALFECGQEEYGIAFLDGYAIVTPTQELADASVEAARDESLGASERFSADTDALEEQGIASGWVDVEAALGVATDLGVPQAEVEAFGDDVESVAFALSATSSSLRLEGVSKAADDAEPLPEVRSLGTLPADTVLGVSGAGAGAAVEENWDEILSSFQDFLDLGQAFGEGFPGIAVDGPVPVGAPLGSPSAATNVVATLASPSPAPPVPSFDPEAYADDPEGYADDYSQQLQDYEESFGDPSAQSDPGTDPSEQDPSDPDSLGGGPGSSEGGTIPGLPEDVEDAVAQVEELLDVTLPEDLVTLLGDGISLYVGGEGLADVVASDTPPDPADVRVGVRTEGDAEAATDVAERLVTSVQELTGLALATASSDDLVAIASNDEVADALVEDGDLAGSDAYGSVVGDEDGQVFALFADVGAVLDVVREAFPEAAEDPVFEGLSNLDAVGVSGRQVDGGYTATSLRVGFTEE